MIASRLGYVGKIDATQLEARSAEVGRLLNGMIYRFKEPANREDRA